MRALVSVAAVVVSGLILAVGSAMPAASGFKTLASDPRDAGGQLDLRGAKTLVPSGPTVGRNAVCKTTISTWGPWKSSVLHGGSYVPGKNKLEVLYAFNQDKKPDLTGYIIFAGGLHLYATTSDGNLAPIPVAKRASSITVALCDFRDLQIQPQPKSFHVAFLSIDGRHRDRMPNRGWVKLTG